MKNIIMKARSILLLFLSITLVVPGFLSYAHAEEENVRIITDLEEFLEECSIEIPEGAKFVGAAIFSLDDSEIDNVDNSVVDENVVDETVTDTDYEINWGTPRYWLENITTGEMCGEIIDSTSGKGPATLTLSISDSFAASWSSNTGISASVISSELGWDVTRSYQVTRSYSVNVPSGKRYQIIGYIRLKAYNFEVWYNPVIGDPYRAGYGNATKPIDICFTWFEI